MGIGAEMVTICDKMLLFIKGDGGDIGQGVAAASSREDIIGAQFAPQPADVDAQRFLGLVLLCGSCSEPATEGRLVPMEAAS